MKKNKFIVMAAAGAFLQFAAVQYGNAQDIVPVSIHTLQATENNGKLVYNKFGNKEFIARCAADNGITNVQGLSLVYVRSANAIVVTDGTNAICTPLTFVDAAVITSTNQSHTTERLLYVFTEGASIATGTMASTEHYQTRGQTNRLTSLVGQIQYWADDSTNGTAIYRGTITSSNAGGNGGGNGNAGGNNGNGNPGGSNGPGGGPGGTPTNSVPRM